MNDNQLTKQQRKRIIHGRIWLSGFIATVVFLVMMYILGSEYSLQEAFIHFIVFYGVWVILHYIFLRKQFKAIDES